MTVSLLTLFVVLEIVSADISHFFPDFGIFHQPQVVNPIYGPPPPINSPPTTEFFIPEVIVNRKAKPHHQYIPPSIPIIVEDIPQNYLPPAHDLSRQNAHDPNLFVVYSNGNEGYVYDEPTSTTSSSSLGDLPVDQDVPEEGYDYHPPNSMPQPPSSGYLPPLSQPGSRNIISSEQLHINVKDIRCMNSGSGFFRAIIKIEDGYVGSVPLVDYEPYNNKCDFKLSRNYVAIDIEHYNFNFCGVIDCGNNLCLRVRFPVISGLKSGADNFLTLQCKPQNRVVAKSHSFKMGVVNDM